MKKDGHYWLNSLTSEERKRFLGYVGEEHEDVYFYLSKEFNSFTDFVTGAFLWGSTDEGHGYWYGVSLRKPKTDLELKYKIKKFVMV